MFIYKGLWEEELGPLPWGKRSQESSEIRDLAAEDIPTESGSRY